MNDYLRLEENYIVMHKEFFDICPDSKQAGVILSYLYGWHITNTKHRTLHPTENRAAAKEGQDLPHDDNMNEAVWVYLEEGQICDGVFRIMSEDTFRKAIAYLVNKDYIRTRRHPKYKYTPTKQYQIQLCTIQNAINQLNPKFGSTENNDLLNRKLGSYVEENRFTSYIPINTDIIPELKNSDNSLAINEDESSSENNTNEDTSFVATEFRGGQNTNAQPHDVPKKRGRPPGSTNKVSGENKPRPRNKRYDIYTAFMECRGEDPTRDVAKDMKLRQITGPFLEQMEAHDVKSLYDFTIGKWRKVAEQKGTGVSKPEIAHLKKNYSDWLRWKEMHTNISTPSSQEEKTPDGESLLEKIQREAEEQRAKGFTLATAR